MDLLSQLIIDYNTMPFLARFLFIGIITFGFIMAFYILAIKRTPITSFIVFILFTVFVIVPVLIKMNKDNVLLDAEKQKLHENMALGIGLIIIGVALAVYRDWI
jgi:drug/metabolite transporter (DMT)-like permease